MATPTSNPPPADESLPVKPAAIEAEALPWLEELPPKKIVSELDRYIVGQDEAKKAELRAKGYGFYASGALESLTKLTYDEIVDQEIGFIGTPEKVIRQIRNLQAKGGIGELAIVSNFGGLEHWKSIKTQHLFAERVMPAFRGNAAASQVSA